MTGKPSIGFLGGGKMAEAIIGGLGERPLQVFDIDEGRCRLLKESYGVGIASDIASLLQNNQMIVLALKPQILPSVLSEEAEGFTAEHLVMSIAAGIPLAHLRRLLSTPRLVRVMPNTPALVGKGVSVACGTNLRDGDREAVDEVLSATGRSLWLEEHHFDAVTAVSGSGPAYVYLFIEALIDAGVNQGLPRDVARMLAVETVVGGACMVRETGRHTGELRDMVTSPGGTTIRAVEALEELGLRNAVNKAVSAAARRSRELGGTE